MEKKDRKIDVAASLYLLICVNSGGLAPSRVKGKRILRNGRKKEEMMSVFEG